LILKGSCIGLLGVTGFEVNMDGNR
jgi:hypothetical protein